MTPPVPPSPSARRKVQQIAGYAGFSLLALTVGFLVTFPYDALKERARVEADNAGYVLRLGSVGPGFFSLRATDVAVSKRSLAEPPPEALAVDSVSLGPSLWPPGAKATVRLLGGTLVASVSGLSAVQVRVDAEGLDLSKGNLKAFSGLDLAGTAEAHLDLSVPRVAVANAPAEPDLAQASGSFTLDLKGVTVNGGTLALTIPQYGNDPTPFDLPRIAFGDVSARVKVDKGAATVEEFKARSADLEASVAGSLKLGKRLEYSEANLEVRLKPEVEFQKRLGLIGSALSMIPPDPKDPTWRVGHLTGLVGRPQFR
jgi:type II secretion system protein N